VITRFKNFIRRQVSKIFGIKDIEKAIKRDIDISDSMKEALLLWDRLYKNKPPWLEEREDLETLNIPAAIASELARLVTIEMESVITGKSNQEGQVSENERAEYLNKYYQNVISNLRVQTEYACATGGMVFKPYVVDDKLSVDYVQATDFYPIEFDSDGNLIAVVFPDVIQKGKNIYTRLEYHHLLQDGIYYIQNTAYVKEEGGTELGVEIDLTEVEEWENLEPELNLTGVERPLFSYFKMPLANNIDSNSNIGVSVYGKIPSILKQIDIQYSRILWEYEGTELAIDISLDMLEDGVLLPKGKDRIFRRLDTEEDSFYQVFNPDIRDTSLYNGLNKLLQRVEFNCGLAYGTLSDIQVVEKTAEEIKTSKQRSYSTIVDIQKSLQDSLENLIYAMDYLTTFYGLAPKGEYEVSFHFDDSIIIDEKSEQAILLQEVAAGLIKPEYYLMKRYGVEEEEAKKMLPDYEEEAYEEDEFE